MSVRVPNYNPRSNPPVPGQVWRTENLPPPGSVQRSRSVPDFQAKQDQAIQTAIDSGSVKAPAPRSFPSPTRITSDNFIG